MEKMNKSFLKAKVKAIEKLGPVAPDDDWNAKKLAKLNALNDYPSWSGDIRSVGVAVKVILLRAELKDKFPDNKFSVRVEYYSGGSAIRVHWSGPYKNGKAIDELCHKYSNPGATDSSIDYFDYDNHVSVSEDYDQQKLRHVKCDFCNSMALSEHISIDVDDKKYCAFCFRHNHYGKSFKVIAENRY